MDGVTREHVYPRAMRLALHHNIVLAHPNCNSRRGSRAPTEEEIAKTIAIYQRMGYAAFITRDEARFLLLISDSFGRRMAPTHPSVALPRWMLVVDDEA